MWALPHSFSFVFLICLEIQKKKRHSQFLGTWLNTGLEFQLMSFCFYIRVVLVYRKPELTSTGVSLMRLNNSKYISRAEHFLSSHSLSSYSIQQIIKFEYHKKIKKHL